MEFAQHPIRLLDTLTSMEILLGAKCNTVARKIEKRVRLMTEPCMIPAGTVVGSNYPQNWIQLSKEYMKALEDYCYS